MALFYIILILCFLITIGPEIVKWSRVARFFTNIPRASPNSELQQELCQARLELQNQRSDTATGGEYSRLVKIMRAEQKVKSIEKKIQISETFNRIKGASVDLVAGICVKILFSLILAIICMRNRYEPVLIFSPELNLKPFEGLLSFPTGVANAISVPMWIFSCQATFRLYSFLLKQ